MALSRRGFFQLASGGAILARPPEFHPKWREARELVRQGRVGRVVFCRVSRKSEADAIDCLRSVFDGALPVARHGPALRYANFVAAYARGDSELVICGTEATLVVDQNGCRRFA